MLEYCVTVLRNTWISTCLQQFQTSFEFVTKDFKVFKSRCCPLLESRHQHHRRLSRLLHPHHLVWPCSRRHRFTQKCSLRAFGSQCSFRAEIFCPARARLRAEDVVCRRCVAANHLAACATVGYRDAEALRPAALFRFPALGHRLRLRGSVWQIS